MCTLLSLPLGMMYGTTCVINTQNFYQSKPVSVTDSLKPETHRLGVAGSSMGYLDHFPQPKAGSTPANPFLTAVSPIFLKHSNGSYPTLSPPVHSNAYHEHEKVFPNV